MSYCMTVDRDLSDVSLQSVVNNYEYLYDT